MKKEKLVSLMLIASMALGMSGCGTNIKNTESEKGQVTAETPAWQQYADDPITLDWYVNYSWFVTGWGENLVSKTITEETGVSVNFITPLGTEEEKLNALISSDTLPDIITLGWWEPQYMQMIQNGQVYALNELADQYDPYFYNVVNQKVVDWYTVEDGNIYAYPNSSVTPEDVEENQRITSNETFLVRKDIYEAIGSPDMTTPEGFYSAVVKAKEMFPEVDGGDLIPIGAHVFEETGCTSFDQYLQNFLAVPFEKDGEYYDRNTDPEYIRWLKMFRQLGEDGYLADDIFVDSRTQTSEKLATGRYFCLLYQWTDMQDQEKLLYANDPDSIYIAVEGPRNSNGDDPILPTGGINGWTVTLISKNCEHPERAIAFIDYLLSEHGQMVTYLGVEGETYDVVDGEYVLKDDVLEILNTNREEYDRLYGADFTYWMLQDMEMETRWKSRYQEPIKQLAEWTMQYATYIGQYEIAVDSNSEVGIAVEKTDRLWSTTIKELLLAESEEDFDEILAEYVKKRDAMGWNLVMEEKTRQMKENKKRLGLE
ncbi:MAG: extracellular solute-binding protein [Lachnospiraceae bacterium]|nr:extracellular solute-binding protein [Lachnospiraceae bacterium]